MKAIAQENELVSLRRLWQDRGNFIQFGILPRDEKMQMHDFIVERNPFGIVERWNPAQLFMRWFVPHSYPPFSLRFLFLILVRILRFIQDGIV
jgi:hypothetical protein